MCQNFYLFVLQVIFYGAFQLQKLHQCALFCRCIFIFLCLSDLLQFLFINDLLSKGWLIYKTGSVPTSIALITGVEKKVHISAAQ